MFLFCFSRKLSELIPLALNVGHGVGIIVGAIDGGFVGGGKHVTTSPAESVVMFADRPEQGGSVQFQAGPSAKPLLRNRAHWKSASVDAPAGYWEASVTAPVSLAHIAFV